MLKKLGKVKNWAWFKTRSHCMRSLFVSLGLGVFSFIQFIVSILIVMLAILLVTLVFDSTFGFPFLVKLNTLTHKVNRPFFSFIQENLPYEFYDIDWTPAILVGFYMLIRQGISYIILQLNRMKLRMSIDYDKWRTTIGSKISEERKVELDKKIDAISTAKTKDRKKMLEEFVQLKTELDSMGQECAFLAIDVVDSTGMKADEDKLLAAYDFDKYNEIVKKCLKDNAVIKFSTTPDGIMSCFRTADNAVQAAVQLLEELKIFNKMGKKIKRDFDIRCGINAGFVYLGDMPLEMVTDRVINIAGHMQKHAKPNTINIAGSAIEPLRFRKGFVETTEIIDDQRVFVWEHGKES